MEATSRRGGRRGGRRAARTAALLLVAAAGCYDGAFLDLACDRQGTCPNGTTTDASTGASSSTTDGGPTLEAFRVDTITIADPHFYYQIADTCTDVTDQLELAIASEVADGALNLVLLFDHADPAAATVGLTFTEAICVLGTEQTSCGFKDADTFIPVSASNSSESPCDVVTPGTTNPAYESAGVPNVPPPICFASPRGPVVLPAIGALPPITFEVAQVAASYGSGAAPVDGLVDGILAGYMPASKAMTLTGEIKGIPFELWSSIAGSGASCNIDPMNPLDDTDADPDPNVIERGVWFYFNFTATRVDWIQ